MVDPRIQRVVFDATSRLTNHFPRSGARVLDAAVGLTAGNRALSWALLRGNLRRMRRLRSFHRFLIVPDIHIGDALFAQAGLTAIRDFFPDAEIDFVVNSTASTVIVGHPEATRVIPLFTGGPFPSASDMGRLREIVRDGAYDLCFNLSPFIPNSALEAPRQVLLNFETHGAVLVQNERNGTVVNHFMYQTYRFLRDLLSAVAPPVRAEAFAGARTVLGDEAIAEAERFAGDAGIRRNGPIVHFNPDAATRFTTMPFATEVDLVQRLAALRATLLISAGHTSPGIGERLIASLPSDLRPTARVVPEDLSLDAYTALIDLCDVFITGDTGPLHLAAARRCARSGAHEFRNRTAVLSFFGATTPRMSGYDSSRPGYFPANQDAPSWCYTAVSPCRNLTCLNKMFKTCAKVRCFEETDTAGLASLVGRYIERLGAPSHR